MFIQKYVGANDLAAVVHTSGRSDAAQEFTTSQPRLLAAVDKFMGRKLTSATQNMINDVQNRAGKFANVSLRNILAAANAFKGIAPDNSISIVDPPKSAASAYPIPTYTWVIAPTKSSKAQALRKFIFYAVGAGQKKGPKLLFVPLPKPILVAAEKTIAKIQPAT